MKDSAYWYKYNHSPKGKARYKKYNHSPKRRACVDRYRAKPQVKEHRAWKARSDRKAVHIRSISV